MIKREQYLVSIIVPVYNIEKYILECIQSLVNQTYTNLQIILVDDGSKDNSGIICDEWAAKDQRIEVIHKVNGGLSDARNAGLDKVKGEYIFFVDGDDYVLDDFVESIMNAADSAIPFVGGSYYNLLSSGKKTETVFINEEFSLKQFKQQILSDGSKVHFISVWGVRYLTSYIKKYKLRFDIHAPAWEDMNFNIKYLSHCDRILSMEKIGYVYRYIEGSMIHQFYISKMDDTISECKMLENFLDSPEQYMRLKFYYWHRILEHYYKYYRKTVSESIKSQVRTKIKETYKNEYFRSCKKYFRKYGSLDERIETYLMGWYRHRIYNVILNGLKIIKRIKQ